PRNAHRHQARHAALRHRRRAGLDRALAGHPRAHQAAEGTLYLDGPRAQRRRRGVRQADARGAAQYHSRNARAHLREPQGRRIAPLPCRKAFRSGPFLTAKNFFIVEACAAVLKSRAMSKILTLDLNDRERRVLRNVEDHGCHIAFIRENAGLPGFAYSIGLYHNFRHPEIILFGLEIEVMTRTINQLAQQIRTGKMYDAGFDYPEVLDGLE